MRWIAFLPLFLSLAQFGYGADKSELPGWLTCDGGVSYEDCLTGLGGLESTLGRLAAGGLTTYPHPQRAAAAAQSCESPGLQIRIYPLQHVSVQDAAAEINSELAWAELDPTLQKTPRNSHLFIGTKLVKPAVHGVVVDSDVIISADEKTNSLIVISSPEYTRQIGELIDKADQPKKAYIIKIEFEYQNGDEITHLRPQFRVIEGQPATIQIGNSIGDSNAGKSYRFQVTAHGLEQPKAAHSSDLVLDLPPAPAALAENDSAKPTGSDLHVAQVEYPANACADPRLGACNSKPGGAIFAAASNSCVCCGHCKCVSCSEHAVEQAGNVGSACCEKGKAVTIGSYVDLSCDSVSFNPSAATSACELQGGKNVAAAARACVCCLDCKCASCGSSQEAGRSGCDTISACPSACGSTTAGRSEIAQTGASDGCELSCEAAKSACQCVHGDGCNVPVSCIDVPSSQYRVHNPCDAGSACGLAAQQASFPLCCDDETMTSELQRCDREAWINSQYSALVDQYNQLFEQRVYAGAEAKAKEIKALDPQNPVAELLFWKARFAHRIEINEQLKLDKEESYWNQLHEVEQKVIQLTLDKEQMLEKADDHHQDEAEARIAQALGNSISLHLEDVPLRDVCRKIAKNSSINVVLDSIALQNEGVSSSTPVSIDVEGIKLKSALNLLLEPLRLAYTIENEVLKITSQAQAKGKIVAVVSYPVADIASRASGCQDGGRADLDMLASIITSTIEPASWEQVGGRGSVRPFSTTGSLVIRQDAETHNQIAALLKGIRELTILTNHTEEEEELLGIDFDTLKVPE